MQRPEWLRLPVGVRWTPATGVGAAAVVVLAGYALWTASGLLGSIFTFGSSSEPSEGLADSLKRHEQLAAVDAKRFNGRSAFFAPPAPVRKAPKTVKQPEPPKPPPPPPTPVAPREYAGPKPVGAVGSLVFFADNSQIRVGEEKSGVKVLSSEAPWSVKLAHGGGEYDVPLWTKGKEEFFNGDWSSLKAPVPGIEPVGSGKSGTPASPAPATGSAAPTTPPPGGRVGPGMPAAPATPAPPTGGASDAPQPSATTAQAPAGANNPWTSEHMAPPVELTSDQISTMSRADAQSSLQAVSRARQNRNLDAATRERLNQEFQQLSNRMNELAKVQSGPG